MIKFLDVKKINRKYSADLKKAISQVIDSGWYLNGEHVQKFENELADYIGVKHCISAGNGLDALRLILKAWMALGEIEPGDEVIVPANTFIASWLSVSECGLIPVPAEPNVDTYDLNPDSVKSKITARTRAIMIVHLYGEAGWSHEIEKLAADKGIKIIEDNAQSIGAEWNSCKTGALGDAGAFSFYPGKILGALGDAGAITVNNTEMADAVRTLGNYGMSKKYMNKFKGMNSRMDEIQAAFLSIKLKHLGSEIKRRREIANKYLQDINNPLITLPKLPLGKSVFEYRSHIWHLFVIRTTQRDRLQQHLRNQGIETLIHYPVPPHKQRAFREFNHLSLPVTEKIHKEVLSLPMGSHLSDLNVSSIIKAVNRFE